MKKPSKAIRTLIEGIKADNKRFERMSPAQKRVQLAKDIIAQLNTKFLDAQTGTYMETSCLLQGKDKNRDLSEFFPIIPKCTVCARGAMFIAAVLRHDKFPVSKLVMEDESIADKHGHVGFTYLRQFFSSEAIHIIESAFEQWTCYTGGGFAVYVDDDTERLILIMENIIVNKGAFKSRCKPQQNEKGKWFTPGYVKPKK